MIEGRGRPSVIRVDNRPEFISDRLPQCCERKEIPLQFIQPGKPVQNAFIERNNGSLRKELLNAYLFYSLQDFRVMTEELRKDYNSERPHEALCFVPPLEYL